jgi:hypothetical protein
MASSDIDINAMELELDLTMDNHEGHTHSTVKRRAESPAGSAHGSGFRGRFQVGGNSFGDQGQRLS